MSRKSDLSGYLSAWAPFERDVKLEMFDDQLTGIHAMLIPNYDILSRENIGSKFCTSSARAKRTLQANAKQYNGELLVLRWPNTVFLYLCVIHRYFHTTAGIWAAKIGKVQVQLKKIVFWYVSLD